MSCVLTQSVIAVGIRADVGVSGRLVFINKDRRDSVEPIGLQIRWEPQSSKRIIFPMRIVGINVPNSTCETQSRSQEQGRAEGMCVVDRECVGIILTLTALAGIGKVLEAIKTPACGVVLI